MGRMIFHCADCKKRVDENIDLSLHPGGKVILRCAACEKKRENGAKFSNMIGNTVSVGLLKRLKA